MKFSLLKKCLYLIVIILFTATSYTSIGQETEERIPDFAEENGICFKCHGHQTYTFYNELTERDVRKRMNPYLIIDSVAYYESNHWNFQCTDCHSYEYEDFPHLCTLKLEEKPGCIDCHGGDDTYADYHFEAIESEFNQSVHSSKHSDEFRCSMCHDPHTYKISARVTGNNLREVIIYDNNICLSCHADITKYHLISDYENPDVLVTHEWLPNQQLHFAHVRCIECHTAISDDAMVAHLVQPKEKAVKKCVECHSANSILKATLYKFKLQEERNKFGFVNASILNDSYIIGANRNIYLNYISIIFFGLAICGILIHIILRFISK
ncbi:MAG: hypothetical protein V2I62_02205 [Bacteroidales bacterium]|jgi:hypothetical protein|nr:hypothetical protein [Bacteroidales bacterium]